MTLPRKRKPQKSSIERGPRREWPRHRKWLRGHECVCTLVTETIAICDGSIEVSHLRTAENSGVGIKPHDSSAVPMCHTHHMLFHAKGQAWFENIYALDLTKLAAEFCAKSPDIAMRESLKKDDRP